MYKKTTLKNGLRIITVPAKDAETVSILVLIGTGSKYETKSINGISHFLEHLFFKGTKKRKTAADVAETLDRVGGMYNAFTGKEYTGFWVKTRSSDFDLALDWISDLLLNPNLKEEDMQKEKGVIVEEIKMFKDSPMSYVLDLWEMLLYKNQPAGRLIIGSEENVMQMRREQILDYFRKQYSASNMVICVAGKMERNALGKIKKHFNKTGTAVWQGKEKVVEKQKSPGALVFFKETDQSHLCLGVRSFDIFDSRRYSQLVLANILGGNASSRLFLSIREKAGLAYYVSTSSETYTDTGYLVTRAGVAHRNVKKVIGMILKEYALLKGKKITERELQKAKDYLKGKMALGLETSHAKASFYAAQELLKREILTPEQFSLQINKVRREDVFEVAKEIFQPEKVNLALIGPFKQEQGFKKVLKI